MNGDLILASERVQEATLRAFKGKLDDREIHSFLEKIAAKRTLENDADASLKILGKGRLICEPRGLHWIFETDVYGAAIAHVDTCFGRMNTDRSSWDAFFRETTGVFVQGAADVGGYMQITWLKEWTPIGQFHGVVAGLGFFECGGNGTWRTK
jgi:hypothetical protein